MAFFRADETFTPNSCIAYCRKETMHKFWYAGLTFDDDVSTCFLTK